QKRRFGVYYWYTENVVARLAKFVEGAYFLEACKPDWGEHEENFSRNLSVLQENMCRERIWFNN
ncbi:MAG TPA: hypothetical protein VJC04_03130, partial [Candidatus Paceibacterota bacterium]